jgi:hypothetical protein
MGFEVLDGRNEPRDDGMTMFLERLKQTTEALDAALREAAEVRSLRPPSETD